MLMCASPDESQHVSTIFGNTVSLNVCRPQRISFFFTKPSICSQREAVLMSVVTPLTCSYFLLEGETSSNHCKNTVAIAAMEQHEGTKTRKCSQHRHLSEGVCDQRCNTPPLYFQTAGTLNLARLFTILYIAQLQSYDSHKIFHNLRDNLR